MKVKSRLMNKTKNYKLILKFSNKYFKIMNISSIKGRCILLYLYFCKIHMGEQLFAVVCILKF